MQQTVNIDANQENQQNESEPKSVPNPAPTPNPASIPLPIPSTSFPPNMNLPQTLPPPQQEQDDDDDGVISRQYVHTVHELMGKDIIIPAPAIPNNWDIMLNAQFEHKFNLNHQSEEEESDTDTTSIGIRVNFEEENDDNDVNENKDDELNENQKSYYHKIKEMNKEENNEYHELLKSYPKRIIGTDPKLCTVWTALSLTSLSSFLHSKKVTFFLSHILSVILQQCHIDIIVNNSMLKHPHTDGFFIFYELFIFLTIKTNIFTLIKY